MMHRLIYFLIVLKMRIFFDIVVSLVILFDSTKGQISDDVVVSLNEPRSKIRGHVLKSFLGQDYYGFQDIPYAVPPVAEYRFAEPKPHQGWQGILNTTSNTKRCMENDRLQTDRLGSSRTEDCLVINVYTPVKNSTAKLPVLFWIVGGAFQRGTAQYDSYNPQHFADHGVVTVTFNYRAGPIGFLTTEDGVIPGNLGLKDQALALKWVNKNIEVFGGDPQKVTIVGQSAGSMSVSFHIISQKLTGLYRAGIMESGTALTHGCFIEHARNYSFQLGRYLDKDFTSNDSKELLQLLRKASAEDILSASLKVQKIEKDVGLEPDLVWAPVVEAKNYENALLTEPMHSALQNGDFDKVPILIGFTSEEILSRVRNVDLVKQSASLADQSPANIIHDKWHISEKDRIIAGEKLKKLYTSKSFTEDLPAYAAFSSDTFLVEGAIRQADLASKSVPVYMYQFSYKGTNPRPVIIPGLDGVGHAAELMYMWFNRSLEGYDLVTSKRLVTMWTNFIKYLNPTPTADETLGLPIWPQVKPKKLVYFDIDSNVTVQVNPKKYLGLKGIFSQYMKPPYDVY